MAKSADTFFAFVLSCAHGRCAFCGGWYNVPVVRRTLVALLFRPIQIFMGSHLLLALSRYGAPYFTEIKPAGVQCVQFVLPPMATWLAGPPKIMSRFPMWDVEGATAVGLCSAHCPKVAECGNACRVGAFGFLNFRVMLCFSVHLFHVWTGERWPIEPAEPFEAAPRCIRIWSS